MGWRHAGGRLIDVHILRTNFAGWVSKGRLNGLKTYAFACFVHRPLTVINVLNVLAQ